MLETAYKIAGNIILVRLKPIKEGGTLNHENQNGFRPNRGCFDAIFSIKTLIKKRREHGLETWLLLIDLVKAFDRVPRELLWRVMLKQGVPPKIVSAEGATCDGQGPVRGGWREEGDRLDYRRQAGRPARPRAVHLLLHGGGHGDVAPPPRLRAVRRPLEERFCPHRSAPVYRRRC